MARNKKREESAKQRARLGRRIERLRQLNKIARKSRKRADRYAFLVAVYRHAQASFDRDGGARLVKAQVCGKPSKGDLVTLIDALMRQTSRDDRRLRSRHAAALKLAAKDGVRHKNVEGFIRVRGGFGPCASQFWKHSKRVSVSTDSTRLPALSKRAILRIPKARPTETWKPEMIRRRLFQSR